MGTCSNQSEWGGQFYDGSAVQQATSSHQTLPHSWTCKKTQYMVSNILLFLITQLSEERQHKPNKMAKAFSAIGRRRMQKMKTVGSKFLLLCPQVNSPEMFKYKQSHKATEVPYTRAALHDPGEPLP